MGLGFGCSVYPVNLLPFYAGGVFEGERAGVLIFDPLFAVERMWHTYDSHGLGFQVKCSNPFKVFPRHSTSGTHVPLFLKQESKTTGGRQAETVRGGDIGKETAQTAQRQREGGTSADLIRDVIKFK